VKCQKAYLAVPLLFSALACANTERPEATAAPAKPEPAEHPARAPEARVPRANQRPPARPAKPRAAERRQPLNVILLTVDSLRADVFEREGRDPVPNLRRLAKQCVVFENHRAHTSFTAQSVPNIMSGRYTSTLYRSGYFFAGYSAANEFFPEHEAQGWRHGERADEAGARLALRRCARARGHVDVLTPFVAARSPVAQGLRCRARLASPRRSRKENRAWRGRKRREALLAQGLLGASGDELRGQSRRGLPRRVGPRSRCTHEDEL